MIRNADQVLVVDDGQIIELGKHGELPARRGFYCNLYMSQSRRQEAEDRPGSDGAEHWNPHQQANRRGAIP